jgi:hypothetical protein
MISGRWTGDWQNIAITLIEAKKAKKTLSLDLIVMSDAVKSGLEFQA